MQAKLEPRHTSSPPASSATVSFDAEALCTVAVFISVLASFALLSGFDCFTLNQSISVSENRRLEPFVTPNTESISTLSQFPRSCDSYFADRLFGRVELISARAFLRYTCFSVGSTNVLVGKDGWLFKANERNLEFIQNHPLYSAEELYWWCKMLEYKSLWCHERGIKFLFYAAPAASTIYPEYLPDGIIRNSGNSRLDQLMTQLEKSKTVDVLDLRPTLRAAKQFPIYLKTDTHWNSLGAFIATQPILNKLCQWFPAMKPLSIDELHLQPEKFSGNLSDFMGIRDALSEFTLRENVSLSKRWHATEPLYDSLPGNYKRTFATEIDDPSLPTAVCIRDSFTISQREYLSNHFRRIVYEWQTEWPADLIEREKPDVVLQEKCEASLLPLPVNASVMQ